MCYWVLRNSGIPIAQTTIQLITPEELETEKVQTELKEYNDKLNGKISS
jgi:hypothetical protein